MELTTLNVLAVWIEEQRPFLRRRGIEIRDDGNFVTVSSGGLWRHGVRTKSVEVNPDMGIDHCKVLIENAVEQVAGR